MLNDLLKTVVPTDMFLIGTDRPFTDFGQFGEGQLDIRVFEQNIWWVDIKGKPFFIQDMSLKYVKNVIRHIIKHVDVFYQGAVNRYELLLACVAEVELIYPNVEEYLFLLQQFHNPKGKLPSVWLLNTPLMIALTDHYANKLAEQ